jgi:tRNA threonylcarbamoyladenosine biosynthesis protein TsaB
MIILAMRTDKPEAELYLYKDKTKLGEIKWQAHRELSNTLHTKIKEILNKSSISLDDNPGIVCFKGPGSFTGLRIGFSVANALSYSYKIPIVARGGEKWLENGIRDLLVGKNDKIALPKYDRPAATTPPRK